MAGAIQFRPTVRVVRVGVNRFFQNHEFSATLVMVALALVYVLLATIQDDGGKLVSDTVTEVVLNTITIIFVVEFAVRFWAADSRLKYLKHHWIDLFAVLPSFRFLRLIGLARLVILVRLLRFIRIAVIAQSLINAERVVGRLRWIAMRNGVHVVLALAFGFIWIGSALAYEFEHGTNFEFRTMGDSIWWAFSTMATLGYGNLVALSRAS